MSAKRKPIYILRMVANGLELHGSVTIAANRYVGDARRRVIDAFLQKLRDLGIEASPKQPEAHR